MCHPNESHFNCVQPIESSKLPHQHRDCHESVGESDNVAIVARVRKMSIITIRRLGSRYSGGCGKNGVLFLVADEYTGA